MHLSEPTELYTYDLFLYVILLTTYVGFTRTWLSHTYKGLGP